MKDNGSMRRLMSITMDNPARALDEDKKGKPKDHEKAASVMKVGTTRKKGKAAAVDGQCSICCYLCQSCITVCRVV